MEKEREHARQLLKELLAIPVGKFKNHIADMPAVLACRVDLADNATPGHVLVRHIALLHRVLTAVRKTPQ